MQSDGGYSSNTFHQCCMCDPWDGTHDLCVANAIPSEIERHAKFTTANSLTKVKLRPSYLLLYSKNYPVVDLIIDILSASCLA